MKDLQSRLERTRARIDALSEEHGSNPENEAELRRLQQLKENLKTDLAEAEQELKYFQKKLKDTEKEKSKC